MYPLFKARDLAVSAVTAMANSQYCRDDMKGLQNFITRVRLCNSREDEEKIINQELAKIRSTFKKPAIDGYTKKKSICKLIYVFLLGKQVGFGQSEALGLLSSNITAEKRMGYLFISILFDSKSDTNALLTQCIVSDLKSNNSIFAYLAIQCVANIANEEMSSTLASMIFDLVSNESIPDYVMQSAILCLLKLVKISGTPSICSTWYLKVIAMMSHGNLGVVFNVISLLDEMIKVDPDILTKKADIVRIVVTELRRILSGIRPGLQEYQYCSAPAPWHIVSFLKVLKHFGVPEDDYSKHMLEEVLSTILNKVDELLDAKTCQDVKRVHVGCAMFFEAAGVITQNTKCGNLWTRAQGLAASLLGHRFPNLRYVALEILGQLAGSTFCSNAMDGIHKKAMVCLNKETDPSIQQRAVDFLCSMSNNENVTTIVADLLEYLKNPECANRRSVAVQIATISENSIPDYIWYVCTLIKLITTAEDVIDDKICTKIVQIVSARDDVRKFAGDLVFEALMEPFLNEKLLIVAASILGEFGNYISESDTTALKQFQVLKSKYARSCTETKAAVLSSFLKMAHMKAALKKPVCDLFRENAASCDLEVQKRSVEYLKLLESSDNGYLTAVLSALLPPECEKRFLGDLSGTFKRPLKKNSNGDDDCPTIFIQVPSDFGPFISANSGVLYEDAVLKITSESSYQGRFGHMTVSFESKFLSAPTFSNPKLFAEDTKLSVKLQQKNQRKSKRVELNFSFECHQVFDELPKVHMDLSVDNALRIKIFLSVPVFINKFFEPVPSTEVFAERWQILKDQSMSIDRHFHSTKSNNLPDVKLRLADSNFSFLTMQRVNASDYFLGCAALCETSQSSIGCLVKLEVDELIRTFRISVRSPDPTLAIRVAELLQNVL